MVVGWIDGRGLDIFCESIRVKCMGRFEGERLVLGGRRLGGCIYKLFMSGGRIVCVR